MEKITPEMREQLRKPLPREAVSPHPTKSYLSSIKSIYVCERINDVFGLGSWTLKSNVVDAGEKMVVIQTVLEIPEYGFYGESYGGNDNQDRGDAYKGATTDALTKIAAQQLEVGIDVFKGLSGKEPPKPPPKEKPTKKELTPSQKLTAAIKKNEYTMDIIQAHMILKYKKDKSADLTEKEMAELTSDVLNCQIPKSKEVK